MGLHPIFQLKYLTIRAKIFKEFDYNLMNKGER